MKKSYDKPHIEYVDFKSQDDILTSTGGVGGMSTDTGVEDNPFARIIELPEIGGVD